MVKVLVLLGCSCDVEWIMMNSSLLCAKLALLRKEIRELETRTRD